jgi:hypothetical protein
MSSTRRQYTYMIQSSYWLTIFPLRGASAVFDMAQLVSLLIVWFRTKLFGRTPREIREVSRPLPDRARQRSLTSGLLPFSQWTKPPEFDFPVYYSNHLLMVAVALVYAPIAPLVAIFAACAFAVSTWVYKYQVFALGCLSF